MLGDINWNPKNIGIVKYILLDIITTIYTVYVYTIDPVSVDVWWSYWWNGSNSSITFTRRTNDEANCLAVLIFYVLPRHTNMITDKGFNLFYEFAGRCVHLFPQEEECTSSSWRDCKMYTSSSRANSQTMQTEINKIGTIAK